METNFNYREKGTCAGSSVAANQLQKDNQRKKSSVVRQKQGQQSYGNLPREFLFAVKSGNIQGQQHILLNFRAVDVARRRKMGIRMLSQTQFLAQVQCHVEAQGFVFDTSLRNICFDK